MAGVQNSFSRPISVESRKWTRRKWCTTIAGGQKNKILWVCRLCKDIWRNYTSSSSDSDSRNNTEKVSVCTNLGQFIIKDCYSIIKLNNGIVKVAAWEMFRECPTLENVLVKTWWKSFWEEMKNVTYRCQLRFEQTFESCLLEKTIFLKLRSGKEVGFVSRKT